MDLNMIVICGKLATDPEVKEFESGAKLIRFVVTVKIEHPRKRLDVIPVTLWDPDEDLLASLPTRDDRLWVVGSIQRRYWESPDGRRSRLEVVAEKVDTRSLNAEDIDKLSGVRSE